MSDWGQGSKNNDIGWGQGANNEIGWGAIHALSYSGDTDIVGAAAADERFIFTVKTDNAGTSASNQFTIPTSTTGITQAFLYDIETSDGQSITGLTGNHTITFPSAGEYEVRISGSFPYMFFVNGGDRLKMLDISNFGIYALGATRQDNAFYGCSNMTITATDSGNFGSATNFQNSWRDCSSLTSFPSIDASSGTNFISTWRGCSSLTSFPLIDTSSGTTFSAAWRDCSSLANYSANSFDNNIATDYSSAFLTTNLTTQSIDDILVSLDTNGVTNGTFFQSGGQAPSATGEAAIDSLVGKGWTITVTGGYAGLGAELITNGSFDTDSNWLKQNNWQITGGTANTSSALTALAWIYQNQPDANTYTSGRTYRISADVTVNSGGGRFGISSNVSSLISESGSYTIDLTLATNSAFAGFRGELGFDGSIDNISVREKL